MEEARTVGGFDEVPDGHALQLPRHGLRVPGGRLGGGGARRRGSRPRHQHESESNRK